MKFTKLCALSALVLAACGGSQLVEFPESSGTGGCDCPPWTGTGGAGGSGGAGGQGSSVSSPSSTSSVGAGGHGGCDVTSSTTVSGAGAAGGSNPTVTGSGGSNVSSSASDGSTTSTSSAGSSGSGGGTVCGGLTCDGYVDHEECVDGCYTACQHTDGKDHVSTCHVYLQCVEVCKETCDCLTSNCGTGDGGCGSGSCPDHHW